MDKDYLSLEQRDLEIRSIDEGIQRYYNQMESQLASNGTPEQMFISQAMQALVPVIEDTQRKVVQGGSDIGINKYGIPLLSLPADKLALITLIVMFNNADNNNSTISTALELAAHIKQERIYSIIKNEYVDVYNKMLKYSKNFNSRFLQKCKKAAPEADVDWDISVRTHLGCKLMQLAIEYTPFFSIYEYSVKNKTNRILELSPELRASIEQQHSDISILKPMYKPMICPPNDWVSPTEGGFKIHQLDLVKDISPYPVKRKHQLELTQDKMPLVYDAINLLQQTKWQINKKVLSVMRTVWELGGNMAGLPPAEPLPLPALPPDMDTNDDAKRRWKYEASLIHGTNARLVGKRKSILTQLWLADFYAKYDEIYFVWQLDWRGRAYPVSTYLHPQADDAGKGLLTFAERVPLGEHGFTHLTRHLANCIGFDKLSFKERERLVLNEYKPVIQDWTKDPITYNSWMDTEDPWQTLAAAFEWTEALNSGDVVNFKSNLPVAVDGSCNGLQHFSAIGKDPIGGAATNLLPSDVPQDIYTLVSNEVCKLLQTTYADNPKAAEWLPKIDRKLVKRAVMTTPYGVTQEGMKRQFLSDRHTDNFDDASFLKDVTYEAVGKVVIAAQEHMDWLYDVADTITNQGMSIQYTAPSGFVVNQEYIKQDTKRILTVLQKINVKVPNSKLKLNSAKQRRGMAPNFIHSLDASHMMLTLVQFRNDVRMIHDSYACHAGRMEELSIILRQTFVDMHKDNLIVTLKKELEECTGLTLKETPKENTLELSKVLISPYFFH